MNQYFQLFQLPEKFSVDIAKLDENYRLLAAQCHPDKFASKSAFEQKQAMMMAATVSEAYRILSNPLDRAAYLLQQCGIEADAPEHTQFSPEFLIQQMQWREEIEEARQTNNADMLTQLAKDIKHEQQQLMQTLNTAFELNHLEQAADLVRQARFLTKLIAEINLSLPNPFC